MPAFSLESDTEFDMENGSDNPHNEYGCCQEVVKPEKRTSEGGRDLASATQPEHCALHLMRVLYYQMDSTHTGGT
jgi:hypothetical protein